MNGGAHNRPPVVDVFIDAIVLEGFARADGAQVARALEAELARSFAAEGVPAALRRSAAIDRVDAGAFAAGAEARPQAIGAAVGRAVYGGLKR